MTIHRTFLSGSAALLLTTLTIAGCAGTARSPALEQARADVAAVRNDPDVLKYAPEEVQAAQDALLAGETAIDGGEDAQDVESKAYVASQRAEAARQIAAARADQEDIARSGEARERAIRQSLEQQLAALQAQRTERGMVVSLAGDLLFALDSAALTRGGIQTVDRVAAALRDNPQASAIIEGHTDDTGDADYNLDLSQRRAEAVRAEIVTAGVSPTRLVARGLGESAPRASNSTDAGRQQNRRVEVIVQDPGMSSMTTTTTTTSTRAMPATGGVPPLTPTAPLTTP